MVFSKAKLFKNNQSSHGTVCVVPYNDNIEYYTFLKQQREVGNKQIIITSDIMINIIRKVCLERKFHIYKIVLVEEDSEIEYELDKLITQVQNNAAYFGDLIEKIQFLSEQSSIDLARVYMKGHFSNGFTPNLYVQANGILGVNSESFDELTQEISTVVERCLAGW